MKTSFISTLSLVSPMRSNLSRMQADLSRMSGEVSTGRLADAGLALGNRVGSSVALRSTELTLSALIDGNGVVKARLSQSQAALDSLRSGADQFLKALINTRDTAGPARVLETAGEAALKSFAGNMNGSDGQRFLFGGINTAVAPIADYENGPAAAVNAAFLAKFGVTQADPTAGEITGAEMADFLDNEFAALFADGSWPGTWSTASDEPLRNRVSTTRTIESSVSANEDAFRKLAMAYTMVGKLGTAGLGEGARQAIIEKSTTLVGEAMSGIVDLQARLGSAQNIVDEATESLRSQRDIVATRIDALEGVDPVETKLRIDTLTTQLEMSYSLTNRLLRLSILNYA